MSQRIIPLTGTESERASNAAKVLNDEIHSTRDQRRLFLENNQLVRIFHGSVADETAMLALNSSEASGCWAGDACFRADKQCLFVCVTSPGTSAGHWLAVGPQRQAAVSDVDDSALPGSISGTYSQTEVAGLRTVITQLVTTVETLRDRLKVTGGAGLLSD